MRIMALLSAGLLCAAANAAAAAQKPSCDQIDAAISANEDFAEAALGGDADAAKEALVAIGEQFAGIKASIPEAARAKAEAQIEAVEAAAAAGDNPGAAVAAGEVYRTLVAAFERRLPTTLDVAMLDYSGFRLAGLAASKPVDWGAIAATVEEAGVNWQTAGKRFKDKGLADLMGDIQTGLEGAAAAEDKAWLGSVAQIQLDSVDLLERAVKNREKGACK
jgi:hypothetical protein